MMSESKKRTAQWLGYLGLIPFFYVAITTAASIYQYHRISPLAVLALVAYAAVILSFVGALNWSHAMHRSELGDGWLVWSVVPGLVAWTAWCAALLLIDNWFLFKAIVVPMMMFAFLAQLVADFRLKGKLPEPVLPAWFMRMRIHLTLGACMSLAVLLFIR
jgi:Protein of unknown function (DUF3429)